jgi:hypothetical protein
MDPQTHKFFGKIVFRSNQSPPQIRTLRSDPTGQLVTDHLQGATHPLKPAGFETKFRPAHFGPRRNLRNFFKNPVVQKIRQVLNIPNSRSRRSRRSRGSGKAVEINDLSSLLVLQKKHRVHDARARDLGTAFFKQTPEA